MAIFSFGVKRWCFASYYWVLGCLRAYGGSRHVIVGAWSDFGTLDTRGNGRANCFLGLRGVLGVDFLVCQAQLSGQDRFRLAKFRENGINKTNIFNL